MTATSAPEQPFDGQGLGDGQLDAALGSALADWRSQGADTAGISAGLGDLGGLTLGDTSGTHITIDRDAAGWGWDVDGGRMDLASVVRHEVGHALGLGHSGSGLMEESLAPGQSLSVASAPELPQSSQSDPAPESATPSSTDASATDQSGPADAVRRPGVRHPVLGHPGRRRADRHRRPAGRHLAAPGLDRRHAAARGPPGPLDRLGWPGHPGERRCPQGAPDLRGGQQRAELRRCGRSHRGPPARRHHPPRGPGRGRRRRRRGRPARRADGPAPRPPGRRRGRRADRRRGVHHLQLPHGRRRTADRA